MPSAVRQWTTKPVRLHEDKARMMNENPPIRVLHVVGKMDRGGTETWLMNILRNIDREQIQIDFVVHSDSPGVYDGEIKDLGSQLFNVGSHKNLLKYAMNLRRLIATDGGYDVVHSHVGFFTGIVLSICKFLGVPVRIAHSHNDSRRTMRSPTRRVYAWGMSRLMSCSMTHGLAASEAAAKSMFGSGWRADGRVKVMYCGTDFSRFDEAVSKEAVRATIGVPTSPLVIGNVGRHAAVKNHIFLLRVLKHLLTLQPEAKLVLVGSGPLTSKIEREATQLRVENSLVLLGDRGDVHALLKAGFDVFAFPSIYEGLGLAYVEAQAAGIPCVISDSIPSEAQIVPGNTTRLPLDNEQAWATHILAASTAGPPTPADEALQLAKASEFNIQTTLQQLRSLYIETVHPKESQAIYKA